MTKEQLRMEDLKNKVTRTPQEQAELEALNNLKGSPSVLPIVPIVAETQPIQVAAVATIPVTRKTSDEEVDPSQVIFPTLHPTTTPVVPVPQVRK